MKHAFRLSIFAILTLLAAACGDEPLPQDPDNPTPGPGPVTPGQTWSVNGSVQKGPFTQGTTITIQALDEKLNPTGKNYSTKTTDDAGSFNIGSQIESRYVEIMAVGYYFNEIEGKVSSSTLTLRSLSDLSEEGKTNVNLLTTLESDRMRALVEEGKTIAEARKQAEQEIFAVFNIPNTVGDTGFDKMDITSGTDADAILLAISASLQAGQSVGELSELISKIAGEVASNGALTSDIIRNRIIEGCQKVDADAVRSNLTSRYQSLGVANFVIPPFEDYLDVNGNGVIDKKDSWIILGQNEFVVSDQGGTFMLELQHNVDFEVSVGDCDWLTWQQTKAYLEDARLVFTAQPSEETDERYAVITIKDKATAHVEHATVTQKQKDALTISAASFELEKPGGTFDLVVAHNAEVQLDYSDAPWLTLVETKAMVSNTYTFRASANPEKDSRTGHIVLTMNDLSETVTVYQKGGRTLVLSTKAVTVGAGGGEFTVRATANIEYEVIGPNVAWIVPTEGAGTKAFVTNSHTWTVEANTTGESRQATIVFKDLESDLSETVTVTQEQNNIMEGASIEYKIGWEGGLLEVPVETNAEFTTSLAFEGEEEWLTVVETKAMHSSTVVLRADENPNITPRTAYLWLNAGDDHWWVAITQRANSQQVTVHVPTPGTLSEVISTEDLHKIVNLKITGQLNASDLALLKGGVYHPYDPGTFIGTGHDAYFECDWNVEELDLSEMTTTTNETGAIFQSIPSLTKVVMPLHIEKVSESAFYFNPSLTAVDFGTNSDFLIIGANAFSKCIALERVVLPDNLEEFQAGAFAHCTALKEIVFPESCNVRTLKPATYHETSLGGADLGGELTYNTVGLFRGCTSLETLVLPSSLRKIEAGALAGGQFQKVIFPAGLTSIDTRGLFLGCSRLEEVTLPALITEYAPYMFAGCQSLTKINTNATITKYPDHCFDGANPCWLRLDPNLEYGTYVFANMGPESLEFPEGFTVIPEGMFSGWKNLKNLNLEGIEEIGTKSFDGCESITKIVFPESVKTVSTNAFNCKNLESVEIRSERIKFGVGNEGEIEGSSIVYYSNSITVLIGSNVLSVTGNLTRSVSEITFEPGSRCEEFGIAGNTRVQSISLPSTIKRLATCALSGIPFKNIELPESLEYIGEGAFGGCEELRRISIPASVDTICSSAFYGCKKMYEFSLPETSSLKYIGGCVFGGCSELEPFVLHGGEDLTVLSGVLYYYAGLTLGGELTLGKNVKRLKVGVYGEWSNGEDAASISTFKVQEGSVLEEISITKQYDYGSSYHLFRENASVSLPATIKVIGDGVFSNFKGTINAEFSNLVSIGKRAFYMASCSIPNGFSSANLTIGEEAFGGASCIIAGGFPNLTAIPENAFRGSKCTITGGFPKVVTIGANAFYEASGDLGSGFASAVSIGKEAFARASCNVGSFPKVETIGEGAFQYTAITISGGFPSALSIGKNAFQYSSSNLGEGFAKMETIGASAFANSQCTIPGGFPSAVTIGDYSFSGASGDLGSGFPKVETIGYRAFANATYEKIAGFPKAASIGQYAFSQTSFEITGGFPVLETIGASAFYEFKGSVPDGFPKVETIGGHAFERATCAIPTGFPLATTIGEYAFSQTSFEITGGFPNAVTIGASAFYEFKGSIPDGFPNAVTIGDWAFKNATCTMNAGFPKAETIGGESFSGFTGSFGSDFNSVTSVGAAAFSGCTAIAETITLPNVQSIGSYAFINSPVKKATFGPGLTGLGGELFTPSTIEEVHFQTTSGFPRRGFYSSWLGEEDVNPSLKIYVPASAYEEYYKKWNAASWWSKVLTE
ncbi:MAG: leucine-rich repeat protein [Bacteroidales bacterium]|nr:leucine-rich repeat protein [Bacteroidales bacterium]